MTMVVDPRNALSFGNMTGTEQSPFDGFRPLSILQGDRYRALDLLESYFRCRQHDGKMYDFDGRLYSPRTTMPLLSQEQAPYYVPLRDRRPSAAYPLGKIIVDSFTNLLFGENRFPQIRVEGDPKNEDFKQTIARVGNLPLKMIEARSLGGATGTVCVDWCFYKGRPRYEVHNAKNVHVHEWADRLRLKPRWATEVYPFWIPQWNGKAFDKIYYWFRRDWTPDADIVFEPAEIKPNPDTAPVWIVDAKKSVRHDDGVCHLHWIQNRPSDEIDGVGDYAGLLDQFDTLDVLASVVARGAILNLDPTLKLKMDPEQIAMSGVKKGSDNSIVTGEGGDAEYMELQGTSIEVGIKLIETHRRSILEAAQCIVPDPHEVAAQGVSSVAVKAMFAPMLGSADVLREQYGHAIRNLVDEPTDVARAKMKRVPMVQVTDDLGQPVLDEAGVPKTQPGKWELTLPPKIEVKPAPLPSEQPVPPGKPPLDPKTGLPEEQPLQPRPPPEELPPEDLEPKTVTTKTEREPGEGGETDLRWPPYFTPTPDDQAKIATTLQLATGGKMFLSVETATEAMAEAFGADPAQEQQRVQKQTAKDKAKEQAMFQQQQEAAAGKVEKDDEQPGGGKPFGKPPFGKPQPPFLPGDDGGDEGAAGP